MPSKGTTLKCGPRHNIINRSLWKEYVISSSNDISYKDFKNVLVTSNTKIKNQILDNISGFKLNESLGYIAIKRYKPKTGIRSLDFKKTREVGSIVYHTNFHSFGYKARIMWFTAGVSKCKYINLYKFVPERFFQRDVAGRIFKGKIYSESGYDSFKSKKIKLNFNRL